MSGGQGEYVHKYFWQLPYDEWVGAPRGLILEGQLTYKVFQRPYSAWLAPSARR